MRIFKTFDEKNGDSDLLNDGVDLKFELNIRINLSKRGL